MLDKQEKKKLTAQAAKLNPVVLIGNQGLTEAVQREIARALNDHELIKIRFHCKDKQLEAELAQQICQHHLADLVHRIGHVIVIYKERQEN